MGGRHFVGLKVLPPETIAHQPPWPNSLSILLRSAGLELQLLLRNVYRIRACVTEDAVVNEVVDSLKYAVIAGLRTETGAERLVIAYPSEESLRDLLSAPSILAVGFSSREEAVASSRASVSTAAAYRRMPNAMATREIETDQQGLDSADQRGRTGSTLRKLARFLIKSYCDIATSATVIFSSTNTVSAVIRMALGSSV